MKSAGRPLKGATKRDKNVQLRLSQEDYNKIQRIADESDLNKTDAVIAAVDMMYDDMFGEKKDNGAV